MQSKVQSWRSWPWPPYAQKGIIPTMITFIIHYYFLMKKTNIRNQQSIGNQWQVGYSQNKNPQLYIWHKIRLVTSVINNLRMQETNEENQIRGSSSQQEYEAGAMVLSNMEKLSPNLFLRVSGMILKIKTVKPQTQALTIQGQFLHSNGQPYTVSTYYRKTFLKTMRILSKEFKYSISSSSPQIKISFSLLYEQESYVVGAFQIIKREMKIFKQSLVKLDSNANTHFSKQRAKLQCEELKFKKKVVLLLKNNKKAPKQPEENIGKEKIKFLRPSQGHSAMKNVYEIVPHQEGEPLQIMKGGYLQVEKLKCSIKFSNEQNPEFIEQRIEDLACKTVKKSRSQNMSAVMHKIKKQYCLAAKIYDRKHLARYYKCQKKSKYMFMEYIPNKIKNVILNPAVELKLILNLGYQLVNSVQILHASGIVHRDVKPDNLLIATQNEHKVLKIIDFGESTQMDTPFSTNQNQPALGCTVPYSPLECLSNCEEGFNKPEIDQWSVCILLYELFFKSPPLSTVQLVGLDVIADWKKPDNYFSYPIYRKKRGLQKMQEIVCLTALAGLKVQPKNRLSLQTMKDILFECSAYYEKIIHKS